MNTTPSRAFSSVAAREVVSVRCQTDPVVILPATGAAGSAVALTQPPTPVKPETKTITSIATSISKQITKPANTSAANTTQAASTDIARTSNTTSNAKLEVHPL